MKKLILILVVCFAGHLYAQDIITVKDGLYYKNNMAYSGKYMLYFDNGAVKEELTIKDGKLMGEFVKYYETGGKMETGQYDNNLKYGLWFRYSANGALTAQASYKNDKKDGEWIVYGDAGNKLFKMEYSNGEKTGTWFQWDEKGDVVKTTSYTSM